MIRKRGGRYSQSDHTLSGVGRIAGEEVLIVWSGGPVSYTWDVGGQIPKCWPWHAHLVNEIAVVADQRRKAGRSLASDTLEEWHRYCLPAFADRMRARLKEHCADDHQPWPGRSHHKVHVSDAASKARAERYARDLDAVREQVGLIEPAPRPGSVWSTWRRARSARTTTARTSVARR